jgi:hypothetical protein
MHARRTHRPKGRWAPGRGGKISSAVEGGRNRTLCEIKVHAAIGSPNRQGGARPSAWSTWSRGRSRASCPLIGDQNARSYRGQTELDICHSSLDRDQSRCRSLRHRSGLLPNRISRSRSKSTGLWWSSPSPPSVRDIKKLLLHLGTSPVPQAFRPYRGSGLS